MKRSQRTREPDTDVLSAMTERIVECFRPVQVILFGSRARGDTRSGSDVDLLVVMPQCADRRQLMRDIRDALAEFRMAKDVLVTTPDEIARIGNLVGPVLRPALRDGKVLYDAERGISVWGTGNGDGLPRPLQGGPVTDSERLAETHRWLRRAVSDLAIAELHASGEYVEPNAACHHAQQAAEKALKAVPVFLQIEFEKTHNLDELRELIPGGWRSKEVHLDLKRLTDWEVEARYPGPWADPTVNDAQNATRQARAIWESVLIDLQQHGLDVREHS